MSWRRIEGGSDWKRGMSTRHIAFQVDDVETARGAVLANGGKDLGKRVSVPVPGEGVVTFVYVRDPEGNVIELQSRSRD